MQLFEYSYYQKSAEYVKSVIHDTPDVGVVIGSALGHFTDIIQDPIIIDYSDIPNFLISTVKYHDGKLIFGKVGEKKVLCMSGRFHLYEGYSMAQLSIPMRMFHLLGIKKVILTNAAGAVNPAYCPGDFMLISDHIKLTSLSPLTGPNIDAFGDRFFDVSDMYSSDLRGKALCVANQMHLPVHEGVYMYFAGPQFETPAEIRMAAILGADAVGMSTIPEALTSAHCKMQVLGISVITNMAAGILPAARLSHEEVADTAGRIAENFSEYLKKVICEL